MATVNLRIESRSEAGKGIARRLRAANRIPAVLYGENIADPKSVSIDALDFRKALGTGAGSRVVLNLELEGQKEKTVAILREVQRDPVSHAILHADLLAIDLTKPIEISVPIHPEGVPEGVKNEGGVLEWANRELSIRVIPTAIPESIRLDISGLHVNQSVHVSDLEPEGYEILDDPDRPLCMVASGRLHLDEEAEAVEGEEGEEAAEGAAPDADADSEPGKDKE
jgi:large subunit ribosomal protein L25